MILPRDSGQERGGGSHRFLFKYFARQNNLAVWDLNYWQIMIYKSIIYTGYELKWVFFAFMQCGDDASGGVYEEFHVLFIIEVWASTSTTSNCAMCV